MGQIVTSGDLGQPDLPDSYVDRADIVRHQLAYGGDEKMAQPGARDLGFFSTAYEMYMQETLVGDMLRYGIVPTDRSYSNYKYDPQSGFNPYKYFLDNQDTLQDAEEWIRSYLFDDVYDEQQFKDRVERLRKASAYRAELANGNVAGMIVGGIAGFADITTLIPGVNVAKKAGTAWKIGKWALAGAYYSGVQEGALHMRQELRTVDESIYNIIGGTVIGGGFGVFGRAIDPESPLYYKGATNPLKPENPVMMGFGRIGSGMKNNVILKPVFKAGQNKWEVLSETDVAKSAGAMAAETSRLMKTGAVTAQGALRVPVKAIGKAGEFALKKTLGKAIPAVRGLTQESAVGRTATEKLFNIGGMLTHGHTQGRYVENVEDLSTVYMAKYEMDVLPQAREEYTGLRTDLAAMEGSSYNPALAGAAEMGSRLKQFGKDIAAGRSKTPRERNLNDRGKLEEWEFHDLTQKATHDDISPEEMANLVARFGEEGKDAIIDAAYRQAKRIHQMNRELADEMRAAGMEFEDLGDAYAHAQLWNPSAIRGNRAETQRFLLEVFGGKPSDEFLEEWGLTPAQFEKLGVEDVTVNGTKLKPDEGLTQKVEILEEWTAGNKRAEEAAMEMELKLAEMDAKKAQREATLAGRAMRSSWTQIKNASLDELKKLLKYRQGLRDRQKAETDKLRAERKKTAEELKLAEAEMLERMNQFHDVSARTSALRRRRGNEVKEAEALNKMVEKEGVEASKADINFARENLVKADNELERSQGDALNEAVKRAENKPVSNRRIATLQERIRQLDMRIKMKTDAMRGLDERLIAFGEVVTEASAKKQRFVNLQKMQRKMAKETAKTAKKAKKTVGKLKRQKRKLESGVPLHMYVEDLVDKLANNQRDKFGGFESELIVAESGRTKRRHIRLTNAQRREAERLGILRNDLYGILGKQVSDIAPRIAMRKIFGGTTEKGIVQDLQRNIRTDYETMIDQARRAGKNRRVAKLERQMETAMQDVENAVLRHLGVLGLPKDGESMLGWAGLMARQVNYVRYGSGFLIPSLADLSNVVFTSGWGTFSYKNLRRLNATFNNMSNREIRLMALMSERILHQSRTMKMNQAETMQFQHGIGAHGSRLHYTTSTFERAMGGLSEATNVASGMAWWNTRMKALAMVQMQDTFVRHAMRWDEILSSASAKDQQIVAEMASLGLGKDQMRGVVKMMQKHAAQLDDGIYELNMGRWLNEGKAGQDAYEAVNIALNSVATRAIMTPGKGDTPFLMSDNIWKTILQFQTYGFVSLNKYMLPAFQRMAKYGDLEAFSSLMLATALGYGIVAATDIKRSGSVKERGLAQWAYDVVDRAGFLMFLSTPLAEASKQFGAGDVSRYSMEKNRLSLIGGPTGGLINDAFDFGSAVRDGDGDRMLQVGNKLLPFKLYKQMADVALGNY